jgi:TonB family protein
MKKAWIIAGIAAVVVLSCSSPKNENLISKFKEPGANGRPGIQNNSWRNAQVMVLPEVNNSLNVPPTDDPKGMAIVDDKPEQHFQLNCMRDTTIEGVEGTKIFIPKEAFRDRAGKTVATIDFGLREYYNNGDIVLAGLTTQCNKKMLETGGMVYLSASSHGSECALKRDKNIELSFISKTKKKDGMQLFTGNRNGNTIDWVLEKQLATREQLAPLPAVDQVAEEEEIAPPVEVMEEDVPVPATAIEGKIYQGYDVDAQPEYPGGNQAMMDYVARNINYPQYCQENCIQGRVFISFTVDADGNVANPDVMRGVFPALDKEARRIVSTFPQWKPAKKGKKEVACQMVLPINYKLDCSEITASREQQLEKYYEDEKVDVAKEEQADLQYYVLASAKLGWINCDRFPVVKETERVAVNETDGKNTNIFMVFKNINSVAGSVYDENKSVFGFASIPPNEKIILMGFKKVGDKNYIAVKETSTSIKVHNLAYKEVSLEELKATVKKLNGDGGGGMAMN